MKAATCCACTFWFLWATTTESEIISTYDFFTTASLMKFSSLFYIQEHTYTFLVLESSIYVSKKNAEISTIIKSISLNSISWLFQFSSKVMGTLS